MRSRRSVDLTQDRLGAIKCSDVIRIFLNSHSLLRRRSTGSREKGILRRPHLTGATPKVDSADFNASNHPGATLLLYPLPPAARRRVGPWLRLLFAAARVDSRSTEPNRKPSDLARFRQRIPSRLAGLRSAASVVFIGADDLRQHFLF